MSDELQLDPNENIQAGDPANVKDEGQLEQPVTPQFDSSTWGLNYRGQMVYPKDRDNLKDLAQQGYGYSQKMEALNSRQKELDAIQAQYGTYADMDKALTENPILANKINELYLQHQNNELNNEDEDNSEENAFYKDPRYLDLQTKVENMSNSMDRISEQEMDKRIAGEMESIKSKYPDKAWGVDTDGNGTLENKIMQHAIENNIDSLEIAFRNFIFDQHTIETGQSAVKQYTESLKQNKLQGIIPPGNNVQPPKNDDVQYDSEDSYQDLSKKAMDLFEQ